MRGRRAGAPPAGPAPHVCSDTPAQVSYPFALVVVVVDSLYLFGSVGRSSTHARTQNIEWSRKHEKKKTRLNDENNSPTVTSLDKK